jgi:hypothetical protein
MAQGQHYSTVHDTEVWHHVEYGEKQIEGSVGSLEPPGPLLMHLLIVYMEYSECPPTLLNPLAERTCFSQVEYIFPVTQPSGCSTCEHPDDENLAIFVDHANPDEAGHDVPINTVREQCRLPNLRTAESNALKPLLWTVPRCTLW